MMLTIVVRAKYLFQAGKGNVCDPCDLYETNTIPLPFLSSIIA